MTAPVEPSPTPWVMPDPGDADEAGVAAVGADLAPGTLLAAYRAGLFPMHLRGDLLAWWSPDPRGVIPLDGLVVSRSLQRSCRRYTATVDQAFDAVIDGCGDRRRADGWINGDIRTAYVGLHELGWAHSVEAWDQDGSLAGGLYGVAIGGLFAGESMFHQQRDGSKVALVHLVDRLRAEGGALLDVQWCTDHLASLGALEIPRDEYLTRLADALTRPGPDWDLMSRDSGQR